MISWAYKHFVKRAHALVLFTDMLCVCDTHTGARFLSLVWSKLRLCWANHRAGYFSELTPSNRQKTGLSRWCHDIEMLFRVTGPFWGNYADMGILSESGSHTSRDACWNHITCSFVRSVNFPAFPVHAQTIICHIWQESYWWNPLIGPITLAVIFPWWWHKQPFEETVEMTVIWRHWNVCVTIVVLIE